MLSFSKMVRGAFIVFEGLDRSGKTTQSTKLLEHLKATGKRAIIQRFPDRSEPTTGPTIDNYLRHAKSIGESKEAIHLLFSANRWVLRQQLQDALESGITVIVDRYSFSGITYTMSKDVDKHFSCSSEVGLLKPDTVLYFQVDPNVAAQRGGYGGEVLERSDFQQKVSEHMGMFTSKDYWKIVNANQTIDEVHKDVITLVDKTISASADKPLTSFTRADFDL